MSSMTYLVVLFSQSSYTTCMYSQKREMSVDDNLCTLPHSHTGSVSIPSPAPPPPLTRRDLAMILDEIEPVEDWRSLGLELRVPARKLSHIQHKFPVESLEQVLLYWISSEQNCSWKYLVAALRKIKEVAIANRISKKFISRGAALGGSILSQFPNLIFESVLPGTCTKRC